MPRALARHLRLWFVPLGLLGLVGFVALVVHPRAGPRPDAPKARPLDVREPVNALAFAPDSRTLAVGHGLTVRGGASLWDVPGGTRVAVLPGHEAAVQAVRFSADGRLVATAGLDPRVRLYTAATGQPAGTLGPVRTWVLHLAFTPDDRRLAVGENDGRVTLWDVVGGRPVCTTAGRGPVALSPDGATLAVVSRVTGEVEFQEAASGGAKGTTPFQESGVRCLAWAPDGRRLAVGSESGTTVLLEGECTRSVLRGHSRAVVAAAFSPDGRWLATASDDRTALLWDATTGRLVARLDAHTGAVNAVTFSPDGRLLATGSYDGKVLLWPVESLTPQEDGDAGSPGLPREPVPGTVELSRS